MKCCPRSPPGQDSHREVKLQDKPSESEFVPNSISTTKYNFASFIPRFLFEQFRKYWNLYFLTIGGLQQIPDISPTGRWNTIGPLVCVLLMTAGKEAWEDLQRRRQDRKINQSTVQVLCYKAVHKGCGDWIRRMWRDVKVGDILKIENKEAFPADLILLSSSEEQGVSYIETSNLDGETNLKVRQSLPCTASLMGQSGEAKSVYNVNQTRIQCEGPSKKLYDFAGNLSLPKGNEAIPLTTEQLLLRGSRLMNTKFVIGVVIYTGHETKLFKNASEAPLKESSIQQIINVQIIFLFFLLIFIAVYSAIWKSLEAEDLWYVESEEKCTIYWAILTFIILYNNVIPISLQITLEMVKICQAKFISWDEQMFHPRSEPGEPEGSGTYALARTSNLNEELGQIKYVFSDKTGTLTQNVMVFKYGGISGNRYSGFDLERLREDSKQDPMIVNFLTVLSVCQTTIPHIMDDGSVHYNASSPDEKAFVDTARDFGFKFLVRTPDSVKIKNWDNEVVVYDLLATIEFTSARKRMSVLVRTPQGKILLLTKGADSVIMARMKSGQNKNLEEAQEMINQFARQGLRTMALGMREVGEEEYKVWIGKWQQATVLLLGREEAMDKVAKIIEVNLTLVGVTAIEDKLQDKVPETIANLLQAGIHVWVLTGDKQETAIDIGRSCRMITEAMEPLIKVNAESAAQASQIIQEKLNIFKAKGVLGKDNEEAVIIDGQTLGLVLESETVSKEFAELGTSCKSVICCRVSPSQKADVVKLVQGFTHGAVNLAIGDGANDVAMIQAARVGVGISGNEGLQAANSADFSVAQFRFLQRLLFVHGAWNYSRISKVLVYSFYKNISLYTIQMWFAIYNMWTGQTLFDPNTITMFNVLFTFLPPFTLGLFDRFEDQNSRMNKPSLYCFSQNGLGYNQQVFWRWICQAILHSVILFWLPMLAMNTGVNSWGGQSEGRIDLGNTVYTCVVITVIIKALIEKDIITGVCIVFLAGSVLCWFVVLSLYSYFWLVTGLTSPAMLDSIYILATNTGFWLCVVTAPTLCVSLDLLYRSLEKTAAKYQDKARHNLAN